MKNYILIIIVLFLTGTVNGIPVTNGLVGYWSGDDSTANDSSGNNLHGVFNGASFAQGISGQAFSFNGSNNIVIADSPLLDGPSMTGLTLSAWVNLNVTNTDMTIVSKFDTNNDGLNGISYLLEFDVFPENQRFFVVEDASTTINGKFETPFGVGQWHHLAGTWDGSVIKMYFDGVEVTPAITGSTVTTIRDNTTPLTIGSLGNPSQFFNGLIDEVAIYNRALSDGEVNQLFSSPAVPEPSSFLLFVMTLLVIVRVRP